jgi:hypothetical protein
MAESGPAAEAVTISAARPNMVMRRPFTSGISAFFELY